MRRLARVLLAAFVYLLFAYVNSVVQSMVEIASDPYDPKLVAADVLLKVGDVIKIPTYVANYSVALFMLAFVIRTWIAAGAIFNGHTVHYLYYGSAVFALRAVSILATALPKCTPTCVPTAIVYSPLVEGALIVAGIHRTCADLFFSGHAANITLMVFISIVHTKRGNRDNKKKRGGSIAEPIFDAALFVLFCGTMILIPISKFHYTIDMIGGMAVAMAILFVDQHFRRSASPSKARRR